MARMRCIYVATQDSPTSVGHAWKYFIIVIITKVHWVMTVGQALV